MTYKAVGRSIINYAAPVWSTNLRDTNYINIQYTQNKAMRIATGCHKMSSVDYLHAEAKMLMVREHSELLSAQYLARCLEPGNVCHSITTREIPKRRMKETLFTRRYQDKYPPDKYPRTNTARTNTRQTNTPRTYTHHSIK